MFRKILTRFHSDFNHYVKKIEAQAKKWFSLEKRHVYSSLKTSIGTITSSFKRFPGVS